MRAERKRERDGEREMEEGRDEEREREMEREKEMARDGGRERWRESDGEGIKKENESTFSARHVCGCLIESSAFRCGRPPSPALQCLSISYVCMGRTRDTNTTPIPIVDYSVTG